MQYVTDEYKEEMKERWRGHTSVTAKLKLYNPYAQKNASISSSFTGSEALLYKDSPSSYQGVVSTEDDGSITFTFGQYHELNIAGLTLVFSGTLPSTITVTNGTKSDTVAITENQLVYDEGFMSSPYIKITPNSGKLALKTIYFGIELEFTDKQIISTSRDNVVSHISNSLPVKTFTLVVDNRNHLFNKDNPYGYAEYIQEQQMIEYNYGYEMSDGSVYTIKGGKVFVKSWSSDDYQATFNCMGKLNFLVGDYYKGQYYEDGISAYDLTENVLIDAGVEDYIIDSSLRKTVFFNPLPICPYNEALQMIANASRSVLYEDRDGNICVVSGTRAEYIKDIFFEGATSYSIPSAILNDNSLYNYADAEHEYVYADGSLLFLPENETYRQVGYVSDEIADLNGAFTHSHKITMTFKTEFDLKRVFLKFAVVIPTSVTVVSKRSGSVVDTQSLTNLSITTVYSYEGIVDEIEITFNGASPNQRIHLNSIELDGGVRYNLTYHELKNVPMVNDLERVSRIDVHSYVYDLERTDSESGNSRVNIVTTPNEEGGETVDITTIEGAYGSAIGSISAVIGDNRMTFSQPYYDYKVSNGTIKESGAYYIVVSSDKEQDIEVYAHPFTVTDNIYTLDIHETGVEKKSTNPLIGSSIMANQQAEWLREYYNSDVEYSLTYRGDTSIDADDLIYLENNYVADNEVRIEEETINTSMGMDFSCKLVARRVSYRTDANLERAIVGRFKTGENL